MSSAIASSEPVKLGMPIACEAQSTSRSRSMEDAQPRTCGKHLLAEEPDLVVAAVAPELEHHVRTAGVPVLLDRGDAFVRRAGDRLALVEDRVRHRRLRREPTALLHRLGDRPDLVLLEPGQVEQRVGRPLDVLHLVREVHARDLARAVAPGLAVGLVDRRDDRAADVDVGGDVVARVADESGRRDRRRQAAVADLARERLHLRRGRGDVDRRDVARRVRVGAQTRNRRTPGLALVLERLAAEDAAHDRHRVAHRPERLRRLRADVVQEDLRRPEAEEEATRAGGLLHHSCIHRNLHRVTGERRDDPPPDRETLRLPSP